jgi:hypothetical protein
MSFANLKKQSKLGSLTEKLVKQVEKMNSSGSSSDERFWKLECDKTGNGYAVIRFLPPVEGEETPFVKLYSHAFQGTGGWLIDSCLTSLNQKCPVCEYNSGLWNSGVDANKEIARTQKRKLTFISNIYVVRDPANPENEGKVFLFKYGKKIQDKITEALNPEFDDDQKLDPFDFWKGSDFKLKAKKVAGYRNYDSSSFSSPSPLNDDDEVLEAIWNKEYSLKEFVDPENFKSYDQMKKRLDEVLGTGNKNTSKIDSEIEDEDRLPSSVTNELRQELNSLNESSEDDGIMNEFAKLLED